jgi:lysophospholipase L1-like esterase
MMMEVIGNDPVLWVNVWYDSTREGYQEPNALAWNSLLIEKKKSHPNMKIFDWATIAKSRPEWFISDKIHFNSNGARQRAWWLTMISRLVLKIG